MSGKNCYAFDAGKNPVISGGSRLFADAKSKAKGATVVAVGKRKGPIGKRK